MNLIENIVTIPVNLGAGYVVDHSATVLAPFLNGTLTELNDITVPESVTRLRNYQFQGFSSLTTVDLSRITQVGIRTFSECSIHDLNMPNLTNVGMSAFSYNAMTEVELPSLLTVGNEMFRSCHVLQRAEFLSATSIDRNAFYQCESLDTLILRSNSVVELIGTGHFYETKIEAGEGYIYVPSDLVETYKRSSGWIEFASQIRSIDEP